MSDAIEAYNTSLEAMAAACEEAKQWAFATLADGHGEDHDAQAHALAKDMNDAAAFIRSQMLRPIEDAPKDGTQVLAYNGDLVDPVWLDQGWYVVNFVNGAWQGMPWRKGGLPFPTDFITLPQIGGSHE